MPSKEHEALVEKVATVLNEQEGCYLQPQDYHRGAAKEVLSIIRADLQEQTDAIVTAYEDFMNKAGITSRPHGAKVFRAMLAASALGEQSE